MKSLFQQNNDLLSVWRWGGEWTWKSSENVFDKKSDLRKNWKKWNVCLTTHRMAEKNETKNLINIQINKIEKKLLVWSKKEIRVLWRSRTLSRLSMFFGHFFPQTSFCLSLLVSSSTLFVLFLSFSFCFLLLSSSTIALSFCP